MKTKNRAARPDEGPGRSPLEIPGAVTADTASGQRAEAGDGVAPGDTVSVSRAGRVSDATLPSAEAMGAGAPAQGQRLGGIDGGRFELLERLGGGGMSDVFLARDTVLDRRVAIKFLTSGRLSTTKSLHRIQQEAQACARLNHENIVRLFDMGTDRGLPFLVMEYLEGTPLDALVRRDGKVDVRYAVRILVEMAKGLSQAHRAGIVHRDLKPSNVFITHDGTVKILDFGVATMTARPPEASDENVSGTPRYMSPEQWRGEEQDGRTDIWAAGVMLFELLTGRQPFRAASLEELRDRIISADPAPSLRRERPDLPEEADRIAQRAMKKNAGERFGTADELLDALVALELTLGEAMRSKHRANAPPKPRPERRQTTVLSCSFHELSERALDVQRDMGLDEVGESFVDVFEICASILRELEGTLVSSLGPRIVACFGYPIAHEDSAQRALRAAALIVDAIQRHGRELGRPCAVRIGIGTSLALVSAFPARAHTPLAEMTPAPLMLHGDALHVAQWLEQRAGDGEILISRVTQLLSRGLFDLEPLGEAVPEGASRPMRLYRVLRSKEVASRFDSQAMGSLTPFVGRERELEILQSLWDSAQRGSGRVVLLTGEAGIGKSRLLERQLERISGDLRIVVRCQCWPHFQNSALSPIVEGLGRKLGLRSEIPAAERIGVLETALGAIDPALREHAPLLAAFSGISADERDADGRDADGRDADGRDAGAPSRPDFLERRMLDALAAIFVRLSDRCPTILVVEDAHWSDGSTLELLDLLRSKVGATSLLVLVTARSEFRASWQAQRLTLGRLSPEETASLVALAAMASSGRELPRPIVEHLVQRTDGVPLFIEELTHWVGGALHEMEQRGGAAALDAWLSHAIPATLEGLLRARLDALPQDGRDVAHLVAVLGRDAAYDLVHATSELSEEALRAGLAELLETGILRRQNQGEHQGEEATYTFSHALVKEAAYQSLVKSKRVHLHRRAAEVLVERFADGVARRPELVAGHFAEAGCHEQAASYFEAAGQLALQRAANVDAATHFGRAIAQLRMLPEDQARALRELRLQIALRTALVFAGQLAVPADFAHRFAAQADESIDPSMMLLASVALASSSLLVGNLTVARDQATTALDLYAASSREAGGPKGEGIDPGSVCGLCLAWAYRLLGEPDRARECAHRLVEQAERDGHPPSRVIALIYLGAWYNHAGELDMGRRLADAMAPLCDPHDAAGTGAMLKIVRGWSRVRAGDPEGLHELEEGVRERLKSGDHAGLSICITALVEAQLQEEAWGGALSTLDEAMTFVARTGERFFEPELHRLRGEVLLAKGANVLQASECFERGLALARQQQARLWEQRLEESYGRLRPSRVTLID